MYRIRFHGRGGHGIKTAGRVLGTAFFLEGFEVQDAPRYGAERRGAPISSYVRAAKHAIHERGTIDRPDLVIVADETLVAIPAAGVLQGLDAHAVLLIHSTESADEWRSRLNVPSRVLVLPEPPTAEQSELPFIGATCAGAGARLTGVISRETLARALETELAGMRAAVREESEQRALAAYDAMEADMGSVTEREFPSAATYEAPQWVDVPFEAARVSAPAIHGGLTSVEVNTGLWRIMRPVVDEAVCNKCTWICGSFCPDSVISVGKDGFPDIDYDHCKGCMICVAVCPKHAIAGVPEASA